MFRKCSSSMVAIYAVRCVFPEPFVTKSKPQIAFLSGATTSVAFEDADWNDAVFARKEEEEGGGNSNTVAADIDTGDRIRALVQIRARDSSNTGLRGATARSILLLLLLLLLL